MTSDKKRHIQTSKLLSLILRHAPETVGLTLSDKGWVAIAAHGQPVSRHDLEAVVRENDKQRFAISTDGLFIRASQGHSVTVDLGLPAMTPPPCLYHGTVQHFLAAIRMEGLRPMQRQHVHLSATADTARAVGSRRGEPVLLTIDSQRLHEQGGIFYRSENGVWLTAAVAPEYIRFPAG